MKKKMQKSKTQWERAYASYMKQVNEWEDKGYIVTKLDKTMFKDAYLYEQRIAAKHHNPKESIIRKIAKESREFTKGQARDLQKLLGKTDIKQSEYFKKLKSNEKERRDAWDAILAMNNEDFNTSHNQYNEVFG